MRALGAGLIIWIMHFWATAGRPVCPGPQRNHCWDLTSSPWWESGKNERPHHRFILLSLQLCRVNRCYIRLCFLKRHPLISRPPQLTTLSVIKRWLLGFQKLTKPMEKKSRLDVAFWGEHAVTAWRALLNIFWVIKMCYIMKTNRLGKKKILTDHRSQRKSTSNWQPHTPHEQFLCLWFLTFWSHAILKT